MPANPPQGDPVKVCFGFVLNFPRLIEGGEYPKEPGLVTSPRAPKSQEHWLTKSSEFLEAKLNSWSQKVPPWVAKPIPAELKGSSMWMYNFTKVVMTHGAKRFLHVWQDSCGAERSLHRVVRDQGGRRKMGIFIGIPWSY